MVDLDVPGSPAAIEAAAARLEDLEQQVKAWADEAHAVWKSSRDHWEGDSGSAYRRVGLRAVKAGDEQEESIQEVVEFLQEYAVRLRSLQRTYAGYLADATTAGLPVSGKQVYAPMCPAPPPRVPPASADAAARDAWENVKRAYDEGVRRLEHYRVLAEDADDGWNSLREWVNSRAMSLRVLTGKGSFARAVLNDLPGMDNDLNREALLGGVGSGLDERVRRFEDEAAKQRALADEARDGARSGNPARRARAEELDRPGRVAESYEALRDAKVLKHASRFVPVLGGVTTVVDTYQDLANGESPSAVGVGLVVGAGVAAVVIAVAAGPAILVGASAGVLGVWLADFGKSAYEYSVPEDVRDRIDQGLVKAWDATVDFAEDAWDETRDVADDFGRKLP